MANFSNYQKSPPLLSLRILNYHEKFVFNFMSITKIFLITVTLFLKFDGYGQSITWSRFYNGPFNLYDYGEDICNADNGNFYIVGHLFDPSANRKIYVLKINPYGDTIWTRIIGDGNLQQDLTVVASGDGGCVLSGYWDSAYALKLFQNGNIDWLKFYGDNQIRCLDIIKTNDNGYLMCGRNMPYFDSYLLKIDSTGNFQWQKNYSNIFFYKVVEAHDSGFMVTASENNIGKLLKMNNDGFILWNKSMEFNFVFEPTQIDKISYGYVLAGSAGADTTFIAKTGLVRVDNNGNYLYSKLFQTTYNEYLLSMTVKYDNRYIFGVSRDSNQIYSSNFRPMITDSLGNLLYINSFPVADINPVSILKIPNGDIIFAGWMVQRITHDRDVFAIRTDSMLNAPPIGIINKSNNSIPKYNFIKNYPNPFNSSTIIKFEINKNDNYKMEIYDVTGRLINTIFTRYLNAGKYSIEIIDEFIYLPSAVYFIKLSSQYYISIIKAVLIK